MRTNRYIDEKTQRPSGTTMRWGMRGIISVLTAGLSVLVGSCVDNEISLFIEHAKVQPEAPDCVTSPSDDNTSAGEIDLAFRNGFVNMYLIQNQLMSREDYDNLVAETNGVFIDSYDVSVTIASTNQAVGMSERLPSPIYIEPESTEVVSAIVLPAALVDELADAAGCVPLNIINYPEESMLRTAEREDVNGLPVPRTVGTINTSVRFYAHSQGGSDLETQRFTFPISACCGCLVEWGNCDAYCDRYCTEPSAFEEDKMCTAGIANGEGMYDCRRMYRDISRTWQCLDDPDDVDFSTCNCEDNC